MKIYITRHAQKDNSQKYSTEEHYHRELTPFGKKQARLLGEYIKNLNITKIYTSDMLRAVQTGETISKVISVGISDKAPQLREADPCIVPDHPKRDEIKILCWNDWNYKPPHGESYRQGRDRFAAYFNNTILANADEKDRILVITHGRVLRLFLSDFLENGLDAIKERYNHVAITELGVSKTHDLTVVRYNDSTYLPNKYRL